jgi:transcription factor C subunit 6
LSNSTLNAYPPAYRDLLLQSANSLTRKDGGERPPPPTLKAPIFPLGVVTPFSTHLASMPRREQVATFKITPDDSPHKESRRDRMREKAKRVAVIPPWQAWEGEGWWPEMCAGDAGEGKGKGKAKSVPGPVEGWQWRSDVRLGLDDVGRDAAKNVIPARYVLVIAREFNKANGKRGTQICPVRGPCSSQHCLPQVREDCRAQAV